MKRLILILVIPLTLLSFMFVSKWWLVNVPDGPGEVIMYGFPFIYLAPGFHTSLSNQIFLLPLLGNLLVYFAISFVIIYIINRIKRIVMSKLIITGIWVITVLPLIFTILIALNPDNVYSLKCNCQAQVIKSGFDLDAQGYWTPHMTVEKAKQK
ncbi:hypothetical protein FUA48_10755 [Flavobacterium alkalisoli]|uniref:Uncharacterized protein n=1 Tax=Flavobacterium alkalisoli TaxID=2602769 RepID=A0A5B9FRP8_9FLAO|nr:hypothetical protein [Flavobacterium alkalisoli]QEE50043.1 hypothetical protein FUA48_10755 [Flavobacterium alkalisoli]